MKQEEWGKSVDDAVDLNWETPYEQKKFIQSLLDKQKQEERTRIIEWAEKNQEVCFEKTKLVPEGEVPRLDPSYFIRTSELLSFLKAKNSL